jgi:uncharacterized OB-fold protein
MATGEPSPPTGAGIGTVRRDGRTDAFFDGAAADRLMIRRCESCARWFAPDASGCPECGTEELAWAEASGEAVLVSWAVAHSRTADPAPLALVELAEGPWMYGRLDAVAAPREGLPLHACFVHPDEGESYPVFKERP